MRQIYVILAGGLAALFLGIGLLLVYDRAGYGLAPPGAADVQPGGPPSARQRQVSYRLPPGRSLTDVYHYLESQGWRRDERAEAMQRRDSLDHNNAVGALTRQRLFGLLSEIALVKVASNDRRRVEIRIFLCFRMFSPNQCR